MLAILLLLTASAGIGIGAFAAVRAWPQADPALAGTQALGERVGRWPAARRFVRSRLDPAASTGLALTLAFVIVVVAGVVLGVIAHMIRTSSGVVRIDQSVARWSAAHVGGSPRALEVITTLGSTPVVVGLALAASFYGWRRRRSLSILFFFTLVVAGQFAASNAIKFAVARVRPDYGPIRGLGTPSFPSGHATAAAATFASLALVLGRDRSPLARASMMGVAVAFAVAVAGSRVLLGVHWLSDVVAGLLLGWAWFAVCAVSFGGRLLWFGAPAVATSSAQPAPQPVGSR